MISFVWKSVTSAKQGAPKDASFASWSMEQTAANQSPILSNSGSSLENSSNEKQFDSEKAMDKSQERPACLQAPLLHGLAFALNLCLLGLMARTLVQESALDGSWLRLAIFAAAPFISIVMLFFTDNIGECFCLSCLWSTHVEILCLLLSFLLLRSDSRISRHDSRSDPADGFQLSLLLWSASHSNDRQATPHHHPDASLQGVARGSPQAYHRLSGKGHLHLRASRRYRLDHRLGRWNAAHQR